MATPRFNLDTYQEGDTGWSHSDTVEFVDEYGIDRGTLANRPSSGTYDDELYYAEDQGLLYQWDSGTSSWDTASLGSQSNPVPDTSYFDGLDANEVNTPNLNNGTVRRLDPSDSESDWQSVIDDVSQNGGGTVVPEPGTYTGRLKVKSDVTLDCLGFRAARFKLPDSDSEDAPVLSIEDGVRDAHIRNVEVDGNAPNNTGRYNDGTRLHGISIEDTDNNNRPRNCSVKNVYVHDCVRTNVVASGRECEYDDLWLEDSHTDHLLYVPRGIRQHIGSVYCSGQSDVSTVTFGTSNYDCQNNTIQKLVLTNPQTADGGDYPRLAVDFRDDGNCKNNEIQTVSMDYESGSDGQGVAFASPNTIGSLNYDGPFSTSDRGPVAMLNRYSSQEARIRNLDINITETSRSFIDVVFGSWDDFIVENVTINESTSISDVDGVLVFGDGNGDIINAKVTNPDIDVSGDRIAMNGGPELIDLELEGVYDPSGITNDINSDDFFRGTMLPQRLNDMSSKTSILWDGRTEFNDGGDGNTRGPAYWDEAEGNWVSVVDNSTWS